MKFIKLLTAAHVSGVLRHPHEGAIPVNEAECAKQIANGVAEDVTEGFTAAQIKASDPQAMTNDSGPVPTPAPANPHQAEIETDTPTKPHRRKAADDKE